MAHIVELNPRRSHRVRAFKANGSARFGTHRPCYEFDNHGHRLQIAHHSAQQTGGNEIAHQGKARRLMNVKTRHFQNYWSRQALF